MPSVAKIDSIHSADTSRLIYVGRGYKNLPHFLGNPFTHLSLHKTRALYRVQSVHQAVEAFRIHLWTALNRNPWTTLPFPVSLITGEIVHRVPCTLKLEEIESFFSRVREESILACHCVNAEEPFPEPLVCHAQVLVKAWRWQQSCGWWKTK